MTSQPNIPANPLDSTPNYPTWVTDELLRDYYDTEWGMPITDERGLFEALSLEGAGGLGGCLVSQDGAQEILKRGTGLVLIHGHRLAGGR